MGVLDDILASKHQEIALLRQSIKPRPPTPSLRPPALSLVERLRRSTGEPLRLLTEIKRRSPSAGPLSTVLSVAQRASLYGSLGATAISVLTDGPFFGGSFDDLAAAAGATDVPLLCKDFILDEMQVAQAAHAGASFVLLIVRIVPDDARLRALVEAARSWELEPLIEVVTESECERALRVGARIVGVNARDLDTLHLDAARAARVLRGIPPEVVTLHLSGLHTPADIRRVAASGADGALLGEALMRQDDPTALLTSFVAAAKTPLSSVVHERNAQGDGDCKGSAGKHRGADGHGALA